MVKIGKLNISLTNCCNHRCFYCRYKHKDQITMTRESLDMILTKTLREYPRLNPAEYNITGGEPFLFPDLIEYFINQLNSITLRTKFGFNTNFTLDNIDTMIELYKFKNFNIHVSLPTFDKDIFMRTVAIESDKTYYNLMNNLQQWMSIIGRDLSINIVVTELNKHTIIDTVKELKKMGVTRFFLSPLIAHERFTFVDILDNQTKRTIDYRVSYKEYGEIVREVNELTGQHDILNNITCTPFCHYPENVRENLREMSCVAKNTFHNVPIYPDGRMGVCNASTKQDTTIGNIFVDDFSTIIKNREKWIENNKAPFEKCHSCKYYKVKCNGGCF